MLLVSDFRSVGEKKSEKAMLGWAFQYGVGVVCILITCF